MCQNVEMESGVGQPCNKDIKRDEESEKRVKKVP
jgi:hypothetical protein